MNGFIITLVKDLQNKGLDTGVRDDIAMDLVDSDDPAVLQALLSVALDSTDDLMVIDSCIDSMARILFRNKNNLAYLNKLLGSVTIISSLEVIRKKRNDLFSDFELKDIDDIL